MKERFQYLNYENFLKESRNPDIFDYSEDVNKKTGELRSVVAKEKPLPLDSSIEDATFNAWVYDSIDQLVLEYADVVKKKKEFEASESSLRDKILKSVNEDIFEEMDLLVTKQIQTKNILLTISKYTPAGEPYTKRITEFDQGIFIDSVKRMCNSTFEAYDLVDQIIESALKLANVEREVEYPGSRETSMKLSYQKSAEEIDLPRMKNQVSTAPEEVLQEGFDDALSFIRNATNRMITFFKRLTNVFDKHTREYNKVVSMMN